MTLTIANPETLPLSPTGVPEASGKARSGEESFREVLSGKEGTPGNYRLSYTSGVEDATWSSPRHRHMFDQIRLVVKGGYEVASDVHFPEGWVGYFPESVFYGPQLKPSNFAQFGLQFCSSGEDKYLSRKQLQTARKALADKGGRFDDGMYVWIDENGKRHQQDSVEACYEHFFGKIGYSRPRYHDFILMDPEAFPWQRDGSAAGISHKLLGIFSERDIRIGFVRMEVGAELNFGTEKSSEILVVTKGAVSHQGQPHGALTAFGSEAEDQATTILATELSELYYVKLPTF